jgi:hypothetical protein
MALNQEKIEHLEHYWGGKSYSRKWMKNQRNRRIRRTKKTEIPNTKEYKGWEY